MNYDHNLTASGRMAMQTVEIKFQSGTAAATFQTRVFGNCRGFGVIEQAVHNVRRFLGEDDGELVLREPNGDTISCELWEFDLNDFVVGSKILEIVPSTFEEVTSAPMFVTRIDSPAQDLGSDRT